MKIILALLLVLPCKCFTQALLEESGVKHHLENGSHVTLFATRDCGNCYYYLPVNLGISCKPDGTPEVSLITWKNDENSKVIGGIMHFLLHWGISQEDEKKLSFRLTTVVDSNAVVMGPASVQPGANGIQFRGNDELAQLFLSHLTSVPPVSVLPGSKMAFSFRFDEEAIGTLMKYVENPSRSGTKMVIQYTYETWETNTGLSESVMELELDMKDILKLIR